MQSGSRMLRAAGPCCLKTGCHARAATAASTPKAATAS